jgi:GDP-L-fucose synthase
MNNFQNKKIYLAGHNGMVGSAIFRELEKQGYKNLVYKDLRT